MNSLRNRILFIVLLTGIAAWSVVPTFVYFSIPKAERNDAEKMSAALPDWLPKEHIKLGLDLQGGVQLVLGVDIDVAIDNKMDRVGTEVTRWANKSKKQVSRAWARKGQQTLRIELEDSVDIGDFKVALKKEFPGLAQSDRDGKKLDFKYSDSQLREIRDAALSQAERVVRNRIDKWGVSEPSISRRVDGSILVQLPGFKNPEKARDLLGRTAQLQFKMVNEEFDGLISLIGSAPEGVIGERRGNDKAVSFISEDRDAILKLVEGKVPDGSEIYFEEEVLANNKVRYTSHLLFSAVDLSGEDILDASVTIDSSSLSQDPAVSLKFTGGGGKRFADLTGDNVNKRMAIVLDNTVVSAPVINQRISGGSAQITLGSGTNYNEKYQEAQDLALILKSGALPAPITIMEQREVGATLGPELADRGVKSVVGGLMLVLLFMLVVYRRPGFISCGALVLNALFLLSLMAFFGFALTLPGFAGFILTLGMAVDANVLINERIKQEVLSGKGPRKGVETAFDKVFWTIIDANVTTLIAAAVLIETNSSGPIKGFAVALILGILVSMFTSLFVTKTLFKFALSGDKSDAQLSRWLGLGKDKQMRVGSINFLSFGRIAGIVAIVIGLAVIGVSSTKGMNWSVDFAGGTEVEMTFDKPVQSDVVRGAFVKAGIGSLVLQTIGDKNDHYLIRFEKSLQDDAGSSDKDGNAEGVRQVVNQELSQYGSVIQRSDFVGPLIGRELREQGILSVVLAILGIVVYIWLRFDMRFAPGAVIKMIVDVFIVMGFYIFFHRSFDLTSIAALLTAVGYSVNDTIVIYDRIRENLNTNPRRKLSENINISLNETLSRTINTSVTTLFALCGILIFGTAQIWNFAAAMGIGVIAATLTSTFVASSLVLWFERWQKNRMTAEKVTA